MELNTIDSAPEQIAHYLLVEAFNALTSIPTSDEEGVATLAECETHVTRAVVRLREMYPYLRWTSD